MKLQFYDALLNIAALTSKNLVRFWKIHEQNTGKSFLLILLFLGSSLKKKDFGCIRNCQAFIWMFITVSQKEIKFDSLC